MENFSLKTVLNRLDSTSKVLLTLMVVAILLPICFNIHMHQNVSLPKYSSFSLTNRDPQVYLQTFDTNTDIALNFFWESGRSADMYVKIKNGNRMYDSGGTFCGYIIVKRDGSLRISGWKMANGHYRGVNGAKAKKTK